MSNKVDTHTWGVFSAGGGSGRRGDRRRGQCARRAVGGPRPQPACGGRTEPVRSKGASAVELWICRHPGRPVRLVWHNWRWRCPAASCGVASRPEVDERILRRGQRRWRVRRAGAPRCGRHGCPVGDMAAELSCVWRTADRAMLTWGQALLAAGTERLGPFRAFRLGETLLGRGQTHQHGFHRMARLPRDRLDQPMIGAPPGAEMTNQQHRRDLLLRALPLGQTCPDLGRPGTRQTLLGRPGRSSSASRDPSHDRLV